MRDLSALAEIPVLLRLLLEAVKMKIESICLGSFGGPLFCRRL